MNTKVFRETPIFSTNYSNGDNIKLYREDIISMEVGDEMKGEDWWPDINATRHTTESIKCVYKDKSGVLLKQTTEVSINERNYSDIDNKIELIWLEVVSPNIIKNNKIIKNNSEKEDI